MLTKERIVSLYAQAEVAMVMAIDKVRKSGRPLADYVLVVADTTHRATWLLIRDISGKELARPGPTGFVGVAATETVAKVLRVCKVDEWADFIETPLADEHMRILVSADGQVNVADVPAFPPLPATGEA